MIDTETKRRSVHGYTNTPMLPVADGTIDAGDREHVAWLYSGIASGAPVDEQPYLGEAYYYDADGATGSISGGTVLETEAIYA